MFTPSDDAGYDPSYDTGYDPGFDFTGDFVDVAGSDPALDTTFESDGSGVDDFWDNLSGTDAEFAAGAVTDPNPDDSFSSGYYDGSDNPLYDDNSGSGSAGASYQPEHSGGFGAALSSILGGFSKFGSGLISLASSGSAHNSGSLGVARSVPTSSKAKGVHAISGVGAALGPSGAHTIMVVAIVFGLVVVLAQSKKG